MWGKSGFILEARIPRLLHRKNKYTTFNKMYNLNFFSFPFKYYLKPNPIKILSQIYLYDQQSCDTK